MLAEHRNASDSLAKLRAAFPLFDPIDFDVIIGRDAGHLGGPREYGSFHYPVGVMSTYQEEMVKRVAAGKVSYLLQLASVDYTLKRYLRHTDYGEQGFVRPDIEIANRLIADVRSIRNRIASIPNRDGEPIGTVMADVTVDRLLPTFFTLITLAHRGLLFESCSVGRLSLEQIAWIVAVFGVDDVPTVQGNRAQSSIGKLKLIYPSVGLLYGWLSDHAHWSYDAHVKVLGTVGERLSTLYASVRHKVICLLIVAILVDIYVSTLERLYWGRLQEYNYVRVSRKKVILRRDRTPRQVMMKIQKASKDDASLTSELSQICKMMA